MTEYLTVFDCRAPKLATWSRFPLTVIRGGFLSQGEIGDEVFDEDPENRQVAVVGERDGDLGRFADFAWRGVAGALGGQIVCPPAGEIAREQIDAEQDVPGERDQSCLESDGQADQEQDRRGTRSSVEVVLRRRFLFLGDRHLASSTRSFTTAAAVRLRSRLSGFRIRRCASTGWAIFLTSSGRAKSRPETAASAWAVRNRAIDARGLPPSRTSSWLAAGVDDFEDVALHLVVDVDLANGLLARDHILGASRPA